MNGDFIWENGDSYKGKFDKGKMKGHGEYTWKNGNRYIGDFREDQMNGKGVYTWLRDGATYEGYFMTDKITQIETEDTQETPEKD